MLFNSIEYLLFFPIITLIYFIIPQLKPRIYFLLLASYVFYMCWNPVYIILILVSTIVAYFVGVKMNSTEEDRQRDYLLLLSLLTNLGILFYFKYYNFLAENVQILLELFTTEWIVPPHSFLLPVGISFFTFQTLSYTIDVYNEKQLPEKDFPTFALYVCFFPQLVAGPIERATNFLPQLKTKFQFDYVRITHGLRMILWGLFKKVVIADRLAIFVDLVFSEPQSKSGLLCIVAALFFVFQVYCDFSAYTDIAIGSAKILGFKLMDNFSGPFYSKNMTEFWRRWHISLSTWIRDYVFLPLNLFFRNYRKKAIIIASLLSFTIFGFWHGANWNYVIWGSLQGIAIVVETSFINTKTAIKKKTNNLLYSALSLFLTFSFFTFSMIIFRSADLSSANLYIMNIFSFNDNYLNISLFTNDLKYRFDYLLSLSLIAILLYTHWLEYNKTLYIRFKRLPAIWRWLIYILLIIMIFNFGVVEEIPFIYFQF